MDQELLDKFAAQEKKLDAIYKEMVRARRFAMWRLILTIAVIVIPLIGLSYIIPMFLKTLPTNLGNLGFPTGF